MNQLRKPNSRSLLLSLLVAAVFSVQAEAKEVTDADIVNDAKTPGDVVTFGMGTQAQRYSGLNKINASNMLTLRTLPSSNDTSSPPKLNACAFVELAELGGGLT